MKFLSLDPIRSSLVAALSATLLIVPQFAAAQIEAGFAVTDITPQEWPVTLRGSFSPHKTEAAHDPLHSRSFAFRNGEGRAVVTIVDIISIAQDTLDEMKAEAAARTGWEASELLIAGTHTHSAPSASGSSDEAAEVAFRARAFEGIVSSIEAAIENLKPAAFGFGSDEEPDEVFNRRWHLEEGTMAPNPFGGIDKVRMNPPRNLIVKPAGPTDPEIAVVSVRHADGKPMGLLANYALHYVGRVPDAQVSADYFGEFARLSAHKVGGRHAGEFVALLSNGTSGDINNSDFYGKRAPREPFEQIRQVATKVSDAAWRSTREMEYRSDLPVGIVERRVTLKNRKPDPELIANSKRILELSADELKEEPRLAPHYALRVLNLAEVPDTTEVVIQAIRVGDQAILAFPFEVLVEIGLDLKERSPFPHTMVITLANGSFGYLPPPHQHELGGYETWLGTNRVEKEASVILSDHLLEMLGELKAL